MEVLDDALSHVSANSDRTVELDRGVSSVRVVVIAGECVGSSVAFTDELVVGRSAECDLSIPAPDVSRRHIRIFRLGAASFAVEDLGSANGTVVAGDLVRGTPREVALGDRIQVGRHTALVFLRQDPVEEQLATQQKMQAIGRLAAGVAHDFNNLLLVMGSCLEHLDGMPEARLADEAVENTLVDMKSAVERAGGLTAQLLSFARKGSRRRESVAINQVAEETARLIGRARPKLYVSVIAPLPVAVTGDPEQLHQVLMNLCLNAADAMNGKGQLEIEVRGASLTELQKAQVSNRLSYAAIRITDTGVGMDAETVSRIFEPFFTRKGASRGTGLGLATVYGIVKEHGGDVLVESTPGVGTTFRVLLPVAREAHTEVSIGPLLGPPAASLSDLVERVLLVEDQELVLRSTQRMLSRSALAVEGVLSGAEAIDLVRTDPDAFDAVLLDLNLGAMDGEEVLERMLELAPHMRVVVTSGFLDASRAARLRALGATALLDKPFSRDQLLRALSSGG